MNLLRLVRPLLPSPPISVFRLHYWTMSENKRTETPRERPRRERRPPLTHFLCLPLINAVSLPQLESSLATFTAAIPSDPRFDQNDSPQEHAFLQQPLIPDGAVRPIGTLHLTLGVMSLPTRERLDEAIQFFHSLDLVSMMREAEEIAKRPRKPKRRRSPSPQHPSELTGTIGENEVSPESTRLEHEWDSASAVIQQNSYEPLTISLESLHALPRARAATVLHAAPVDSTSRLYPFCVLLRNKFLEAGFLQGEQIKDNRRPQGKNEPQTPQKDLEIDPDSMTGTIHLAEPSPAESQPSYPSVSAEDHLALLSEMPVDLADEPAQRHSQSRRPVTTAAVPSQLTPKSKIRPLLLHATVVNTIYIRGWRRGGGSGNGRNRRNNQYTFDARDILAHYRDYYLDSQRATPRSTSITITSRTRGPEENIRVLTATEGEASSTTKEDDTSSESRGPPLEEKRENPSLAKAATAFPFVWAKDFPLETICICEMGAKKLEPDDSGMNARLGEEYRVVAERSLDFTPTGGRRAVAEGEVGQDFIDFGSSDESIEGGVKI